VNVDLVVVGAVVAGRELDADEVDYIDFGSDLGWRLGCSDRRGLMRLVKRVSVGLELDSSRFLLLMSFVLLDFPKDVVKRGVTYQNHNHPLVYPYSAHSSCHQS
jgi:hypothetical protein